MSKTFLFQAIQLSQTVLIQNFSLYTSMQFSSVQTINRALSDATILRKSGPRSNGKEEMLCIPQCPSITGTSPSDCECHIQDTRWVRVLLFYRGAVCVFYSPSWMGRGRGESGRKGQDGKLDNRNLKETSCHLIHIQIHQGILDEHLYDISMKIMRSSEWKCTPWGCLDVPHGL